MNDLYDFRDDVTEAEQALKTARLEQVFSHPPLPVVIGIGERVETLRPRWKGPFSQ